MNPILFVHGKPMINPLGQHHQITRLDVDAHPFIAVIAYIKESRSAEDVMYFFGIVNVLLEEGFYLEET